MYVIYNTIYQIKYDWGIVKRGEEYCKSEERERGQGKIR